MSYKHDICILLKEYNKSELFQKIKEQGFNPDELVTWYSGTVKHHRNNFCTLNWNYVKWDAATDEVVELIEEYVDMLNKNNIPFRYITIGELGEVHDIKNYGADPDEDIAVIASVYAKPIIYNGLAKDVI